jgi:hypothetical protein
LPSRLQNAAPVPHRLVDGYGMKAELLDRVLM